ncbi:tRNA (adenosine(37)-N6)-threonylcarbamoyltransferase complex transferase subunit TsaD [Candidatus Peregrinibacteria bacterium]|nr:tRNA (adenosine(37)-N6)-threonylcarbamoyltransferase complex transferase subunit TsaD [Candidatus Peregrinibacteria bacterium]
MKILGIETSCDETACAVVEDGWKVLSNVIYSQIDLHAKTGGVVPEVAAREHVLKMIPVLEEAIVEAEIGWEEIDAVAVTRGPGLLSSLIIGTETANVISYAKGKILIPVQHIAGHIYSNWLEAGGWEKEGLLASLATVKFPVLILTVSGGHNELILMRGHGDFEMLGETRDDAAGEAFDKVARILGLGYPGGPAISRMAEGGNAERFKLPRIFLEKGSLDFSFSGLKTAVLNEVKKTPLTEQDEEFKKDMAASFQEAVVEVLAEKLMSAYKAHPDVKELHLAGGVSANKRLREAIQKRIDETGNTGEAIKFRYPSSLRYCTDNAAMIAAAAYFIYKKSPENYRAATNIVPTTSFEMW